MSTDMVTLVGQLGRSSGRARRNALHGTRRTSCSSTGDLLRFGTWRPVGSARSFKGTISAVSGMAGVRMSLPSVRQAPTAGQILDLRRHAYMRLCRRRSLQEMALDRRVQSRSMSSSWFRPYRSTFLVHYRLLRIPRTSLSLSRRHIHRRLHPGCLGAEHLVSKGLPSLLFWILLLSRNALFLRMCTLPSIDALHCLTLCLQTPFDFLDSTVL